MNRTLMSLSLASNQIGDKGAVKLGEVIHDEPKHFLQFHLMLETFFYILIYLMMLIADLIFRLLKVE